MPRQAGPGRLPSVSVQRANVAELKRLNDANEHKSATIAALKTKNSQLNNAVKKLRNENRKLIRAHNKQVAQSNEYELRVNVDSAEVIQARSELETLHTSSGQQWTFSHAALVIKFLTVLVVVFKVPIKAAGEIFARVAGYSKHKVYAVYKHWRDYEDVTVNDRPRGGGAARARLDQFIKDNDHRIIWTPPYTPRFQPIERVWAMAKGTARTMFKNGDKPIDTLNHLHQVLYRHEYRNKLNFNDWDAGINRYHCISLINQSIKEMNKFMKTIDQNSEEIPLFPKISRNASADVVAAASVAVSAHEAMLRNEIDPIDEDLDEDLMDDEVGDDDAMDVIIDIHDDDDDDDQPVPSMQTRSRKRQRQS